MEQNDVSQFSIDYIRNQLARSEVIFSRGENIFVLGNYSLIDADPGNSSYRYSFDGSYGDYEVTVSPGGSGSVSAVCTCPYPYNGCKHIVAAFLDISQRIRRERDTPILPSGEIPQEYLTPGEIRDIALASRRERAKKEFLKLVPGEMCKGPHVVRSEHRREYQVTIYNPVEEAGHCTCPDFATNHLDTCKHLLFACSELWRDEKFSAQAAREVFPFAHVTWNSRLQKPVCYYEKIDDPNIHSRVGKLFNEKGIYSRNSIQPLFELYSDYSDRSEILQFDERLVRKMEDIFFLKETAALEKKYQPDYSFLTKKLYPYQEEGVRFALFRKAAVIADEMGLGKTVQAIALALGKREIFGFTKTLVIVPASLKNQWKLEIEKFSGETALVISGSRKDRISAYLENNSFFKITNYEALLRDITTVISWNPDFVILDEAQRIKNFETKTHQAIKQIPHQHSLVITGTPLENKLQDLYSIIQFSDPELLTPLWAFAANHYALSKENKNKILGYRNLDIVHEKVKSLLIRRTKREVFESLPEITENTYFLELSHEQEQIHQGYMSSLLRIVTKKFLTPMDIKMMQKILLCMRMVCNSTYLIDKKTNISPKLTELVSILKEIVQENRRKAVIFSEWTTMTYLIGKVLSDMGINFVEFSGKVPVEKRQLLIDEFRDNPDCMIFLSSDAGGVGLNLQNCDCLINIELPWNPARLNQRIGRIHRIGQQSEKVNIINMITRGSIEEKVYAGIGLKQELFDAVLTGNADTIDFSRENRNKFLDQVKKMFGEEIDELSEPGEKSAARPELDEQTPHYLNPAVLREHEPDIDISEEETADEPVDDNADENISQKTIPREDLEAVLTQGMAFLNTLTRAATGKPLFSDAGAKSVEIDNETGEVVLRFKL